MRDPCLDPLDQNSPGEQIPICLDVTIYGDLCDGSPFDIDFDHSRQADRAKHADPGHWPDVRCFDIQQVAQRPGSIAMQRCCLRAAAGTTQCEVQIDVVVHEQLRHGEQMLP